MFDGGTPLRRATAPKARQSDLPVPSRYEEIVDAAAEIFARKGYAATSIQEVADAVGILKGSLYHYIHSKEDLLHAVVLEAHRSTVNNGRRALEAEGDGFTKLTTLIRSHVVGLTGETLTRTRVFYNEYTRLPRERFESILAARDTYERDVRRIIEIGQADGSIRSDLDPALSAITVLAVLNSLQSWYHPGGKNSVEEIVRTFTEILTGGMGAAPGPSRRRAGKGATTEAGS